MKLKSDCVKMQGDWKRSSGWEQLLNSAVMCVYACVIACLYACACVRKHVFAWYLMDACVKTDAQKDNCYRCLVATSQEQV
jgi:hypothetical protein